MINVDKITDTRPRPIVLACRLTIEEYEEFQTWKQSSKIETNSIAVRKALNLAINGDEEL